MADTAQSSSSYPQPGVSNADNGTENGHIKPNGLAPSIYDPPLTSQPGQDINVPTARPGQHFWIGDEVHRTLRGSHQAQLPDSNTIDLGDGDEEHTRQSGDRGGVGRGMLSGGLAGSSGRTGRSSLGDEGGLSPNRIGKAIAARVVRAARRGNLPFLIIFVSCLFVFFSALAGVGYVPDGDEVLVSGGSGGTSRSGGIGFAVPAGGLSGKALQEQIDLERAWAKKARPKDGQWMQKQRDDKAVRRVPPPAAANPADRGEDGTEGQAKMQKRDSDGEEVEKVDDEATTETTEIS